MESGLPGFGPHGDSRSEQTAILVPYAGLAVIAEKMARGCEYKLAARYIELPYGFRPLITELDTAAETFTANREVYASPGWNVRRVFAADDPNIVWYRFVIWETLCVHVHIELEEALREMDGRRQKTKGIDPALLGRS